VILAGGVGSRFWPVSTPARPKQLLPLASAQPLIRDTVDRILPLVPAERLRILTGAHLAAPFWAPSPSWASRTCCWSRAPPAPLPSLPGPPPSWSAATPTP
jgi:hypothetical protein